MADSSEEYIKQHMFGNPQIKPDETRILGKLQETSCAGPNDWPNPTTGRGRTGRESLNDYPEYRLYINSR